MDSQTVAARHEGEIAHHEGAHPHYLRHHFETVEQQKEAVSFGMWLFLLTEIMFFGGLFMAYLLYRNWYYDAFVSASNTLGIGYLLPMIYMTWSLKYGAIAGSNPWQATGLEWQIQSPPPTENFLEIPVVDYEAYDYEWLANKTQHEVTTVG